ncbi:MFS transporter [Brevibacterium casei]|uniref:MFS transporter n=1 Tax=Brevibacterium casei TaxID=33889 RepID=UPI00191B0E94|nr:MFS transporter [Brevibacterium casei]QQT70485.1 MFS transporter [Brevibacterium casei]
MLKPILWPVLIPSLLFAAGLGAILPVLVLGALSLGASSAFAAAIVGIMGAVSLLATVPAGILIDRLGDLRAMVVATVTAIVVLAAIVVAFLWDSAGSIVVYTIALMLFAPVSDVWNLARQAVVAEVMPSAHLAKAMTALGGSMRVGNLVGPIIGAGLMLVFPIWSVFVFAGVAGLLAILVLALPIARIPDYGQTSGTVPASSARAAGTPSSDIAAEAAPGTTTPRDSQAAADSAQHPISGDTHTQGASATAAPPRRARLDVRWNAVILVGISIITLTVARSAQPVVIQLWGVSIGLHESQISLLIAFGAGLELVFMFLGAYIKDHLGRVATLVACLTIFGAGFIAMVTMPTLVGMIVAVGIMAVGNGLGAGVNMTIGADLSPAVGRARFLGIWAIFNNGGKLAGPSVIALVIAIASLQFGVLFTGLFAIAGAVWVLVWAKRIGLPGRNAGQERPSAGAEPQGAGRAGRSNEAGSRPTDEDQTGQSPSEWSSADHPSRR